MSAIARLSRRPNLICAARSNARKACMGYNSRASERQSAVSPIVVISRPASAVHHRAATPFVFIECRRESGGLETWHAARPKMLPSSGRSQGCGHKAGPRMIWRMDPVIAAASLVALALLGVAGWAWWRLPKWQLTHLPGLADDKAKADVEDNFRKT